MNTNKLFDALPRDLQLLVLTEFLGSHTVCKGKLKRKIEFDGWYKQVQDKPVIQRCYIQDYRVKFDAVSFVQFSDGSQLMVSEDPTYGEMGYTFRQVIKRECSWMPKAYGRQYTRMNDSVDLPPFVKHSYPSYKKIVESTPNRLSLIRPCDLLDDEEPHSFADFSPLTLGDYRTPNVAHLWSPSSHAICDMV
jgi:hypothetical protein